MENLDNIKVILVRHGESVANSKGISQGNKDKWTDTPLSQKGKEQAKKVAERLKKEDIKVIYSSDLKRAKETAQEINKFHNVKIKLDKRLRDMLNGEDLEAFIKKCQDFLNDIKKEDINALVVAHGSTCLTLLAITTGSRKEGGKLVRKHSGKYDNTSISVLEKEGNKYNIKTLGCIKHLD